MTKRIDHAAVALALIDRVGPPLSPWASEQAVAIAQVHATLALVEQQRAWNVAAAIRDVVGR